MTRYCYNIVAIRGIAAMPFGIVATPQYFADELVVYLTMGGLIVRGIYSRGEFFCCFSGQIWGNYFGIDLKEL